MVTASPNTTTGTGKPLGQAQTARVLGLLIRGFREE